jgi:enoyl-CoA hydratase/carnithine racemase
MPQLDRHDEVFVLDLGDTENRFHPDWIAAVRDALTRVERAEGHRALVTTATGKYFSNGLDLDWVTENKDQWHSYLADVHELLAHFLRLPLPTVAAIQGHAFAGGAMIPLCHDIRVMRADRGFWCLPEVAIDIAFTPGMTALIQGRLAPQVAHEAMTTGRRYGGTDAAQRAIADHAVAEDRVLPLALDIAGELTGTAGTTLGAIKSAMYADALDKLTDRALTGSTPTVATHQPTPN